MNLESEAPPYYTTPSRENICSLSPLSAISPVKVLPTTLFFSLRHQPFNYVIATVKFDDRSNSIEILWWQRILRIGYKKCYLGVEDRNGAVGAFYFRPVLGATDRLQEVISPYSLEFTLMGTSSVIARVKALMTSPFMVVSSNKTPCLDRIESRTAFSGSLMRRKRRNGGESNRMRWDTGS